MLNGNRVRVEKVFPDDEVPSAKVVVLDGHSGSYAVMSYGYEAAGARCYIPVAALRASGLQVSE